MRRKTIDVDIPPIETALAVKLMFHHLGLAAAMFEAIPESGDSAVRVDLEAWTKEFRHSHMRNAVLAFYDALIEEYKAMEK